MKYNKILKALLIVPVFLFISGIASADISGAAKIMYNKGIESYNNGLYADASNYFQQAINLDPNYIDAYFNLGSILEYMNKDEEALTAFKQIMLRKPDDYEAVYKAAELSHKLGYNDKAEMYLTIIPKDTIIGQKAAALSKKIEDEKAAAEDSVSSENQKPADDTGGKNIQAADTPPSVSTDEAEQSVVPAAAPSIPAMYTYKNVLSPTGIAADSEGNLFVAGFSDNTVYKIPAGSDVKIVYLNSDKIDGPIGLGIDRDDNIYLANYNKDNVLKISSTGDISEFISNIKNPYCIFIKDNILYVSSQGSNLVEKRPLN